MQIRLGARCRSRWSSTGSCSGVLRLRLAIILAAWLWLLVAASSDAGARPLTIEDSLRLEEYGRAVLPDDQSVIFEHMPAYAASPNPGALESGSFARRFQGQILRADLSEGEVRVAPLFRQARDAGYWLGTLSPAGTKLSVFSLRGERLRAGIYDFTRRRLRWLSLTPNYASRSADDPFVEGPQWVSEDQLLFSGLRQGEIPSILGRQAYAIRAERRWRSALIGQRSTSSIDSGRSNLAATVANSRASLLLVDLARGTQRTLADGIFQALRLSPDRHWVAALESSRLRQPDPAHPSGGDRWQRSLVVISLVDPRIQHRPCGTCDVIPDSLQWSEDGSQLIFASTENYGSSTQTFPNAAIRSFDLGTGRVAELNSDRLTIQARPWYLSSCGLSSGRSAVSPMGHGAALCGVDRETGARRWRHLIEGQPPADIANAPADLDSYAVAIDGQGLLVGGAGDLWRLGSGGAMNLTTDIAEPVSPWLEGQTLATLSAEVRMTGQSLRRDDVVLLGTNSVRRFSPASGMTPALPVPDDSELLAISRTGRLALFRRGSEISSLIAVMADHAEVRIHEINRFLDDVQSPRLVQIESRYAGASFQNCLMIPQSATNYRNLPVIVDIYPRGNSTSCTDGAPSYGLFSKQHLVAQGYLVLEVAATEDALRQGSDPAANVGPLVDAAVDATLREGYGSADRLAVWGFSDGMHLTLRLLASTDRFRAAFVGSGVSDYSSHFGTQPLSAQLETLPAVLQNMSAYEFGIGRYGLGATPWSAPEAFAHYSPVRSADAIHTPLLIMQGDFDVFPIGQSQQLFATLYRLGRPARYVTFWGEAHEPASPGNVRVWWQEISAWFDEYLAARRTAPSDVGGR